MKKKMKNYPLYESVSLTNFREMLDDLAVKYQDKTALVYKVKPTDEEAIRVSYPNLRDNIRGLGTSLIKRDLRDKKVALIGEISPSWVYTYYAVMNIGAVLVPIDKEYMPEDMASILNTAECEAIVYTPALKDKLDYIKEHVPTLKHFISAENTIHFDTDESVPALIQEGMEDYASGDNSYYNYEIDIHRLASLVFTSGTTGKGKGVMLSIENLAKDMEHGIYNFHMNERTIMALPPHHTFGSTIVIVGHICQGLEIYLSSGLRYITKEMEYEKPTHMILVPLFVETFYKRIWTQAEKTGKDKLLRKLIKISNFLLKIGIDMRSVFFKSVLDVFGGKMKMIVCGGAALNQDIIDDFQAFGITILNGYGITECSPLISCNRNLCQRDGSVGLPILYEEIKIDSPNENGEGEICVKGKNVMLGYYKNEEATKAVFDEEGFFHTGDIGRVEIDDDGSTWLYITGRIKNLIILSNGKNVYPEEIETEISRIYGVSEAVVYEGESKRGKANNQIVAEIFPDYDALKLHNISDAQEYFNKEITSLNSRMAPYKHIGIVKIREEEFIKNTTRKIMRFKIDKTID